MYHYMLGQYIVHGIIAICLPHISIYCKALLAYCDSPKFQWVLSAVESVNKYTSGLNLMLYQ